VGDHPDPRRIVLCADDFGANGRCSRAIIDLARTGAISAASVLVHAPYAASYGALLISNAPTVSVGLHLDLTEFAPVVIRSSLHRWLTRGFLLRRVDQGRVLAEIRSQLTRFEDLLGGAPAFVDGHCHIHQIPGVREPLLTELAGRYGSAVAVRSTRSSVPTNLKSRFIQELGGRTLHAQITQSALRCNSDFAGAYDFKTTPGYATLMQLWLEKLQDGGMIMCHPELPERSGRPRTAREAEYCYLASSAWREQRLRSHVTLQTFTGT
jgi:chitin disaccharide deacetylase